MDVLSTINETIETYTQAIPQKGTVVLEIFNVQQNSKLLK